MPVLQQQVVAALGEHLADLLGTGDHIKVAYLGLRVGEGLVIRVETGGSRVGGGTPAPEIPSAAVLLSEEVVDGNRIARFARR